MTPSDQLRLIAAMIEETKIGVPISIAMHSNYPRVLINRANYVAEFAYDGWVDDGESHLSNRDGIVFECPREVSL